MLGTKITNYLKPNSLIIIKKTTLYCLHLSLKFKPKNQLQLKDKLIILSKSLVGYGLPNCCM